MPNVPHDLTSTDHHASTDLSVTAPIGTLLNMPPEVASCFAIGYGSNRNAVQRLESGKSRESVTAPVGTLRRQMPSLRRYHSQELTPSTKKNGPNGQDTRAHATPVTAPTGTPRVTKRAQSLRSVTAPTGTPSGSDAAKPVTAPLGTRIPSRHFSFHGYGSNWNACTSEIHVGYGPTWNANHEILMAMPVTAPLGTRIPSRHFSFHGYGSTWNANHEILMAMSVTAPTGTHWFQEQ